jgi:hypothetical protein
MIRLSPLAEFQTVLQIDLVITEVRIEEWAISGLHITNVSVVVRALPLVNKLFLQLQQHHIYVVARKTTGATAMKP